MNWKIFVAVLAVVWVILMCFVVFLNWDKLMPVPGQGQQEATQQQEQNTQLPDNDKTEQEQQEQQQQTQQEQTQQEQQQQEQTPQPEEFTLSFAGDCTIGDDYSWYGASECFLNVVNGDYAYPLKNALPYFEKDDFTMVNFESVLCGALPPAEKTFRFRAPVGYAQVLTEGSVEAVTLANNHSYDYGTAGYESTKNAIKGVGVTYVEEYGTAMHTTKRGLVIGMYASQFGMDMEHMRSAVQKLRKDGAQIVIVAYHGGVEGSYRPTNQEMAIARGCIDAGADIFYGHHPHVLQPMERYKDGLILYSLGNFSFGGNPNPGDYDTAVIQQKILVEADGTVRLGDTLRIPFSVSSKTYINDYCPTPYGEGTRQHFRVMTKLDGMFQGGDLTVRYDAEEEEETPETPETPDVPEQTVDG